MTLYLYIYYFDFLISIFSREANWGGVCAMVISAKFVQRSLTAEKDEESS